jgi:hypothetical protein
MTKIISNIEPLQRVETGTLQINNDWPGTFIRGDESAYYAMQIDFILQNHENPMAKQAMLNLKDILKQCIST